MHKTKKLKEKEELLKTLINKSNEVNNPRIAILKKEIYMLKKGFKK